MRIAPGLLLSVLLGACATAPRSDDVPAVTSGAVAVEQGSIHYEVAGRGEAVLLIHGGFGDRRMWDEQFAELASGFRVVRMDLRGYGQSSFPDAAYQPVADVVALLDHLSIDRVHLVGNSMGGGLAIDVALAHPGRVTSLVVVGSGPNGFPASDAEKARFADDLESIRAVFRTAAKEGTERGAELWKAHPMVAVAHADPRVAPLLHRMIDDNRGMFGMQHWPDDDRRAVGLLAQVRAPTLLVVGDRDIALVRAGAELAAREIPGAKLEVIPGTDHLPQLEAPERFNALLVDFLRRSTSPSRRTRRDRP